jgi:hypothetical protein
MSQLFSGGLKMPFKRLFDGGGGLHPAMVEHDVYTLFAAPHESAAGTKPVWQMPP